MIIDSQSRPREGIAMTEAMFTIASVRTIPVKVINALPPAYQIPDPLPWTAIASPLAAAEDAVARLD